MQKKMPATAKQQTEQENQTFLMSSYSSEHLLPKIKGFKNPKPAKCTL